MPKHPPQTPEPNKKTTPSRKTKRGPTSPGGNPGQPGPQRPPAKPSPPHKSRPKAFPPTPTKKSDSHDIASSETGSPHSIRRKHHRLPDLQEVLDAFDPKDPYLEPEPEPGDFWIPPEEFDE